MVVMSSATQRLYTVQSLVNLPVEEFCSKLQEKKYFPAQNNS